MPIRGENVGTAYVRIIGDGSGLDSDIRRAINDSEPSVRDGAREHGKTYGEEFDKQVRKSFKGNFGKTQKEIFEELNDSLTESLARLELSDRFFKNREWQKFRKRLGDEGGAAGELFGQRLEQKFRDSGAIDRLGNSMDNLGPELRRAQRDLLNEMFDEATAMNKDFDRRKLQQQSAMLNEAHQMNRAFNRRTLQEQANMLAEAHQMNKQFDAQERKLREDKDRELQAHWSRLGDMVDAYAEHEQRLVRDLQHVRHEIDQLTKGQSKLADSKKDLLKQTERLRVGYRTLGKADDDFLEDLLLMERRIRSATPRLSAFDRHLSRIADRMGAGFGRGSRNDFINIIGATVRGMFNLLRIGPQFVGLFVKIGNTFKEAFSKTVLDGGSKFMGTLAGIGALGGTLALSLGAVAAGFAAIALIIGPLIALMSGLLGIVVALASSLSFALIGALGGVIGLLAPLSAGLGIAVAGFLALDDAQKKVLKNDMKPVISAFRELGQVASEGMFANATEQAREFSDVLKGFEPLFRRMGTALSDVVDNWLNMLDSAGFRRFRDEFAVVLPGMVRRLGRIFGNTLGGIGGIFVALIPTIQDTLGWLDRLTQRFSDWANSPKGQAEIENFFERAKTSLGEVWDFLTSVWDVLVKIINSGQEPGNSMFDTMANGLDRISRWLEDNPDAIDKWFEDAEKLFEDLGKLIQGATVLIDKLDSAWGRFAASGSIRILGWLFRILGRAIGEVDRQLSNALEAASAFARLARMAFNRVVEAGRNMGISIRIFVSQQMARTRERVADAVNAIVGFWRRLPGRITGAIGGIVGSVVVFFTRIRTRVTTEVGNIAAEFRRLPGRIAGALAGIAGRVVEFFAGIPGRIGGIVDDIVAEFRGLGARIVAAVGSIVIHPRIEFPSAGSIANRLGGLIPGNASGAWYGQITRGPMLRWVGEEGPEAIVPLNRDLSRVDPSVRWLSAIAQGKTAGMAGGGIATGGKTIDVGGITVVSPAADPAAVAQETVNRLVALGY